MNNIWVGLGIAALATQLSRVGGVFLAKFSFLKKVKEETLSRLFPLAILFCLVFKEVASTMSASDRAKAQVGAVAVVIFLHLWRRSLFLSVLGGTAANVIFLKFIGTNI